METQQAAHPSAKTLAALALGQLPAEARARTEAHVGGCRSCSEFLAGASSEQLQTLLRGDQRSRAEQSTPGERNRDTIAGLNLSPPRPAPAATRPPGLARAPRQEGQPATPAEPAESIPRALREQTKYRVVRLLGRGGMGSVYEGLHERMDRRVAIKVINPELVDNQLAIDRFNAEVQAVSKLDHANIARAYDAETFGSLQAIIMEFVEGQTVYDFMKARLRAGLPLSASEACRLVRQAMVGLQHAHAKGIAHRDLKPQNLMLTRENGIVKILDFGLAKLTNDRSRGLTKTNVTMGTYEYMAPEQALDAASADSRADIYSMGCTLYYLLAGVLPFQYDTDAKLLLAHQNQTPRPLNELRPDVPKEVSDLVARMLAKSPDDRPQTAAEAAQVLFPYARTETPAPAAGAVPQPQGQSGIAALFDDIEHGTRLTGPNAGRKGRDHGTALEKSANRVAPGAALRRWWPLAAAVGAALIGGAVLLAGLFKVRTADGTIALRVNEPNAQVSVDGQTITVEWGDDGKSAVITAPPGKHRVEVKKQGFSASGKEVTLEEGGREILSVALESDAQPKKPSQIAADRAFRTPDFQQWAKEVAALPAEQQLTAIAKKLQDLNPGFDGKLTGFEGQGEPKIERGVVTELGFNTDNVTDITPVRGLAGLSSLSCIGSAPGKGVLSDLSPLQGLRLVKLSFYSTRVADLSPLKGMNLTSVNCNGTRAVDLSPLIGMPLASLRCNGTRVSQLTPLKGMPLRELECGGCNISDLTPLKGMPLNILDCGQDQVSDLSPLKGMSLTGLACYMTRVSDLSPVKGMPLTWLICNDTPISDLSPLDGIKLNELTFSPKRIRAGLDIIRRMHSIQKLRLSVWDARVAPEEFWKKYDDGAFGKPDSEAVATEAASTESAQAKPVDADKFVSLFNSKDLSGWEIDGDDKSGWSVENGEMVAQGQDSRTRNYLLTNREFSDYVLRLEYKLDSGAGSAVAVRAKPGERVPQEGGGRYFDHPIIKLIENPGREQTGMMHWVLDGMFSQPDKSATQQRSWNQLKAVVQGNRIRVRVNDVPIVDTIVSRDARLSDGSLPGLARINGRIGLQKHTGTIRFRNIDVHELPLFAPPWESESADAEPASPDSNTAPSASPEAKHAATLPAAGADSTPQGVNHFLSIFDGKSLAGWTIDGDNKDGWSVEKGEIVARGAGYPTHNFLLTDQEYSDFVLRLEFCVENGTSAAVAMRALRSEVLPSPNDRKGFDHPMIKLIGSPGKEQTGTTHWIVDWQNQPDHPARMRPAGAWNSMEVTVQGTKLRVKVNGLQIMSASTRPDARFPDGTIPGLCRKTGRIGLQKHTGTVRYRNIEVMELLSANGADAKSASATADKPAPRRSTAAERTSSDSLQVGSVWVDTQGRPWKLTITERKGETFRAKYLTGPVDRELSGTIADGQISWLARDVIAIGGKPGGDNTGTINGDTIDFTWHDDAGKSGAFSLKLLKGPQPNR